MIVAIIAMRNKVCRSGCLRVSRAMIVNRTPNCAMMSLDTSAIAAPSGTEARNQAERQQQEYRQLQRFGPKQQRAAIAVVGVAERQNGRRSDAHAQQQACSRGSRS